MIEVPSFFLPKIFSNSSYLFYSASNSAYYYLFNLGGALVSFLVSFLAPMIVNNINYNTIKFF